MNNSILWNYFEIGPVVQEMSSNRFLIWSSGNRSKTIFAILKEGIMGNYHVKLYRIWTSGYGDV